MLDLSIYCAGPISGLSYDEAMKVFTERVNILSEIGFDVFYPMMGKEYLRNDIKLKAHGYENHPSSSNHSIVGRDTWMIDQSQIIFPDFSIQNNIKDIEKIKRVSIGSCCEIGYAYAKNKYIITVMNEENIHRHAFILEMSDIVFEKIQEAYDYLEKFKYLFEKKQITLN